MSGFLYLYKAQEKPPQAKLQAIFGRNSCPIIQQGPDYFAGFAVYVKLGPTNTMSLVAAITLAIAVLGAVLGLINTWHAIDKKRVKIRVRPKHAIPVGSADPRISFCIEITNLSEFAITIDETGVLYVGTDARGAYTQPIIIDGKPWPRRLEARSSVTIYGQPPQAKPGHPLKCAYARTECGVTSTGTSPAFKQLVTSGA